MRSSVLSGDDGISYEVKLLRECGDEWDSPSRPSTPAYIYVDFNYLPSEENKTNRNIMRGEFFVFASVIAAGWQGVARGQNITFLADTELSGPPLEVVHAYYNQWPTGR